MSPLSSDLAAQLIDPDALHGYSLYTLSGLLSDGSPLDGVELRVRNDGVTYGHSSFNLIDVPEPGTVGALGLGGLLAACRRRRRKNLGRSSFIWSPLVAASPGLLHFHPLTFFECEKLNPRRH